ncbi:MAG: hypothetical protein PV344_04405 [Anaplasma sp.]|nr:hypothetical protein [Anaplasma sp.]
MHFVSTSIVRFRRSSSLPQYVVYCKQPNFRGLKFSRIGPKLEI